MLCRRGAELKRRGHRVSDTDDPGWIVETHTASGPEPLWDLDQIKTLIDARHTGRLFAAGCVANQGAVYDHFDVFVLLSARVDLILDRVADRTNPFGSTAEDRTKIAKDLAAFEPLLRAGADREIVTTAPVPEVVAALEHVASGAVIETRLGRAARIAPDSQESRIARQARPPAASRRRTSCRRSVRRPIRAIQVVRLGG